MTTRRGFLGAILAAAAAPAIIKAEALMPVRKIIAPPDPVDELRKVGKVTVVGASGLKTGDVFTMAGVLGASGFHRQFVVTSVSDGGVLTVQAG